MRNFPDRKRRKILKIKWKHNYSKFSEKHVCRNSSSRYEIHTLFAIISLFVEIPLSTCQRNVTVIDESKNCLEQKVRFLKMKIASESSDCRTRTAAKRGNISLTEGTASYEPVVPCVTPLSIRFTHFFCSLPKRKFIEFSQ